MSKIMENRQIDSRFMIVSRVMRLSRFPLYCAAIAGCAQAGTGLTRDGVDFGPSTAMQGIATSGFEVDAVVLCSDSRERCIGNRDRSDNGCWVENTPHAVRDRPALTGNEASDKYGYASHWMEFIGRKTVSNGQYGHLGAYRCKILLERVRVFDKLPPWPPN
jgi:hypothetical protein